MPALKNQAGFIPLIALIIAGIVVASAGGVYVVRKEFIKKGQSGKAALNEEKIKIQLKEGSPLASPTPEPEKQLTPTVYKYEPQKASSQTSSSSQNSISEVEPGFTINPPSGWQQSSEPEVDVFFASPNKDEEKAEGNLIYTQPANIQIGIDFMENYDKYSASLSQSKILDEVIASDIKQGILGDSKISYINDQRTTLNGQEAHLLEFTSDNQQGVKEHVFLYVLIKNKHGVIVSGHAIDSAWSKRAGILKSSIQTFKFTD